MGACQSDVQLLRVLTWAAEQLLSDFNTQDLCMTLWALSWHECMYVTWKLVDHAKRIGVSFNPLCFGALLMECEQRGFFDHEIAGLKGMERAIGNHDAKMYFIAI